MKSVCYAAGLMALAFEFPLLAQEAAPIVQKMPSVQQLFDAGTAAIDSQDWPKALDIYAGLETRLAANAKAERSLAIVRLRKGQALFQLRRTDESETAIMAAMDKLPATDASLREDRRLGFIAIGDIAERRYDYVAATRSYQTAVDLSDDVGSKAVALSRAIHTGIFVDPEQALREADAMIALPALDPKTDPEWKGFARDLRGRVLLNLGRVKEARVEIDASIKLLGGLKYGKVNRLDTTARSDGAIAALRDNDRNAARKYLSYAGAAEQASQGFALGKNMSPPECGGINGPKPEDVAVIELQIGDNGGVNYARPIFYSGPPATAVEFARSVSRWSWTQAELKEVEPFFRAQTRIEMRCTTAFGRLGVEALLTPSVSKWFRSQGVEQLTDAVTGDAKRLPLLRAALAKLDGSVGPNSPKSLNLLGELQSNPLVDGREAQRLGERANAILKAGSAPPTVRAFFELQAAKWLSGGYKGSMSDKYQRRLSLALADPEISKDSVARGSLSIALFDSLTASHKQRSGRNLLTAVTQDQSLAENDPLKVGALIRLANLSFDSGDADAARALFDQTGLSSQQCALVDATPRKRSGNLTSADYPTDALAEGFTGWTVIEFDISADGKTLNERALISFPPFIFGEPTIKAIKGFRYDQRFRPGGGLGCGGQRYSVSYKAGY
jgi:tetratricopeptide (TPR) repeat protein